MQGLCMQGLRTRVACAGVVRKGGGDTQPIWLHRGCTQGLHTRVVHAGVVCAGVTHKGCVQGLHARVVCTGVACKGCAQGLRARVAYLFVRLVYHATGLIYAQLRTTLYLWRRNV